MDNSKKPKKLIPCKQCGAKGKLIMTWDNLFVVKCTGDDSPFHTPYSKWHKTKEEARAGWNKE